MSFKVALLSVDKPYISVAWFTVKPERHSDFEQAFQDSGMLTRPSVIDGYIGAHLFKSADDSNQYCVIGQWTTRESYTQWQLVASNSAPKEPLKRLADSLENNRLGVLFEGPVQSS